ncbi:hypothetical protein GCM10011316_31820 [Roseibium aquae]|uniref:Uncharacterized protein n=1 Tax=Roseibium aquae TaxID=1323746 RepID=A0A916TLN1_9HYPH|nr:hypothetical protein GCM10011316_31820 [Roseibium aquae]
MAIDSQFGILMVTRSEIAAANTREQNIIGIKPNISPTIFKSKKKF